VSPGVASVLVTLVFVAVVVGVVTLTGAGARGGPAEAPGRPWWGNPAVWAMAGVAVVLLGAFVFPRLLGFTFLFLPFIWMRGPGGRNRSRRPPPES